MSDTTSITTEELVLSACIDSKHVSDIMDTVKEDDFFFDGNRQIFRMFRAMYLDGEPITSENLLQLHRKDLERCKMRCSVVELITGFTNWKITFEQSYDKLDKKDTDYVGVLIKRLKTSTEYRELSNLVVMVNDGINKGEKPDTLYRLIEDAFIKREDSADKRSYSTPKEMGMLMIEATAERMDKERRDREVIYTSFKRLNRMTGGFERGDLIILSAASGVGKSAFSINIARDVGIKSKKPVLYLNSEMSDKQQARRYASMISQMSHQAIRDGLPEDDNAGFNRVTKAAEIFAKGQLYTITIPDLQIRNVVAECRRMKDRYDIQLVIVDYVGRMDTLSSRDAQEWQIMEAAARTLKTMAQELDVVVLMVAQLSTNGQSLAKGASMKNECDLWMNLSRISYDERADANQYGNGLADYWNVFLEFKKARNVETGAKVPMHFHGDTLTFTDDNALAQKYLEIESREVEQ